MANSLVTDRKKEEPMAKKPAAEKTEKQEKQQNIGPTTGYRDGHKDCDTDGMIETRDFPDGIRAKGWADTWAKCKNHVDGTKPNFVKV
jgi:hypothetical protein|tara:strand:- start:8534 stop:8797 length:264 start_codon:yes stop_codon:yes gene_type:complete